MRFVLSAAAALIATAAILVAAAALSARLVSCGAAAVPDDHSRPGALFCALTEPPITSETEAACLAFEHLESELESTADVYDHTTVRSGRAWQVLIHPREPSARDARWLVFVSADSGTVIEVEPQR